MKYDLIPTGQFRKDLKLAQKRGYDLDKLKVVLNVLANGQEHDPKYKDHVLVGNYAGCRECHIQPDWLLIYRIDGNQLIVISSRTGTHSDLF